MVKAASPTQTMCRPALFAQAAFNALRARVWVEHIPSADNPAEVLSRAGYADPIVQAHLRAGRWRELKPRRPPSLGEASLRELWARVAALSAGDMEALAAGAEE